MTATPTTPAPGLFAGIALDYWQGLKRLVRLPREIWIVYAIKVLESLAYFSSVLVLMSFLIKDMGLTDVKAGTVFGVFSASMSLCMLFVGFIADALGIRRALLVGLGIALIGRASITFTTDPLIVYPGLAFLAVGFSFMIPLLTAAVKLYTTKTAQKYAYSWFYVVMNVGSLISGLMLDGLRKAFTEVTHFHVQGYDLAVRPLQLIFLLSVALTLVSISLVLFAIRSHIPASELVDHEAPAEPVVVEKPAVVEAAPARPSGLLETIRGMFASTLKLMREVFAERSFWLFFAFIFLLVLVKMIFQYNNTLYPIYMERIGLKDWIGKLYAINPALIILLVPVVTAATHKLAAYQVILIGTFVSASSVFFMGFGESVKLIVAYQVLLSLGEALWSPRLYDYTATIAPKGKEASYMALSQMPMFFAKIGAGPMAGILLTELCPATGPRNTELMWILVGASTLVSPIALLLARRWLDVERHQKHAQAAPAAPA